MKVVILELISCNQIFLLLSELFEYLALFLKLVMFTRHLMIKLFDYQIFLHNQRFAVSEDTVYVLHDLSQNEFLMKGISPKGQSYFYSVVLEFSCVTLITKCFLTQVYIYPSKKLLLQKNLFEKFLCFLFHQWQRCLRDFLVIWLILYLITLMKIGLTDQNIGYH